jgi:asparagine synthase (glutamine-hydrolysing)
MCGFLLTAVDAHPPSEDEARSLLAHRGPDGFHAMRTRQWHLAHTRLAVLDPTVASDQPFLSVDGRWALLFNGEIYNFRALRDDLASEWDFRSGGDTEVLLAGLLRRGSVWLDQIQGMYAFVLVDRDDGTILAARDALGIKPLYCRHDGDRIVALGSAVRSMRSVPAAIGLDHEGLRQAVLFGTPINLSTADRSVSQLPPGAVWSIAGDGKLTTADVLPARWWHDAPDAADPAAFPLALANTIRRHLVSDVPVGVALSGGLDSSTLVAGAVSAGCVPHCFTASFPDDPGSAAEVEAAAMVANRFGARHTIVPVDASEVTAALGRRGLWDEPFAEIAVVPLNRVAAAARQAGVPVLLTGEGADEFFGGYRRFERFRLLSRLPRVPVGGPVGRAAARAPSRVDRLVGSLGAAPHSLPRYLWLIANLVPRDASALLGLSPNDIGQRFRAWTSGPSPFHAQDALELETKVVLPEFYLRKVDLATMAEGVEGRVPYVDLAFLSETFGRTPGRAKDLVRSAMADTLPREILERPKQGFGAPMARWVRSVLRADVEEILSDGDNPIWSVLCRPAAQDLWRRRAAWEAGYGGAFFAIYRWGRWTRGDIP